MQVSGLSGVIAIDCGASHSLAVKNGGTVWAWGYNGSGELGDGTTTTRVTPVQVSGLTGIAEIAGGNSFSLAMRPGAVWAWGIGGKLGNGSYSGSSTPVQVTGLTDPSNIDTSPVGGHSIVRKNDQTLVSWGSNGSGQLGDGSTTSQLTPVQVSGLTGVNVAVAGADHSIALKLDGTVWAWGHNDYGKLGIGTADDNVHSTPIQINGL